MEAEMVDEIAKRKFERIAKAIGLNHNLYSRALTDLNSAAVLQQALLESYIQTLERVTGETPETLQLKSDIEHAWSTFDAPTVMPALEAAFQQFDDVAVRLAQLVGALPKNP